MIRRVVAAGALAAFLAGGAIPGPQVVAHHHAGGEHEHVHPYFAPVHGESEAHHRHDARLLAHARRHADHRHRPRVARTGEQDLDHLHFVSPFQSATATAAHGLARARVVIGVAAPPPAGPCLAARSAPRSRGPQLPARV